MQLTKKTDRSGGDSEFYRVVYGDGDYLLGFTLGTIWLGTLLTFFCPFNGIVYYFYLFGMLRRGEPGEWKLKF